MSFSLKFLKQQNFSQLSPLAINSRLISQYVRKLVPKFEIKVVACNKEHSEMKNGMENNNRRKTDLNQQMLFQMFD